MSRHQLLGRHIDKCSGVACESHQSDGVSNKILAVKSPWKTGGRRVCKYNNPCITSASSDVGAWIILDLIV